MFFGVFGFFFEGKEGTGGREKGGINPPYFTSAV